MISCAILQLRIGHGIEFVNSGLNSDFPNSEWDFHKQISDLLDLEKKPNLNLIFIIELNIVTKCKIRIKIQIPD